MRTIEAANTSQHVELEELIRRYDERTVEISIERWQECSNHNANGNVSLNYQIDGRIARFADMMNAQWSPCDDWRWTYVCQQTDQPNEFVRF